jgi:hypothetical protein
MLRKIPWVASIAAVIFLVWSLAVGSSGPAGANGNATFTANQGTPGSSAWPVSGTVGVNNFPTNQTVSGTVGVSGPLPAGTNNIGDVGISGTPTVLNGDKTTAYVGSTQTLAPSASIGFALPDASPYREVTLYLHESGVQTPCNVDVLLGTVFSDTQVILFSGQANANGDVVHTIDPSPPNINIGFNNHDATNSCTVTWELVGRAN